MKSILRSALLLLPLSLACNADEYHYKNILIGAKASGLGGAYTAIADDISAMIYNPAGLSHSMVDSTASMNVLSWETIKFKEVFSNGDDFSRDSFTVVPVFFGVRTKSGNWDYAFSLAVDDYSKERVSQDSTTDILATATTPNSQHIEFIDIDIDSTALKLGGSIAYKQNSNFSIGASLFLQYREFQTVQSSGINNILFTDNGNIESGFQASRRVNDASFYLQPSIGLLWKKNNLTLGANLTYDIAIKRTYDFTSSIFLSSPLPFPPQITPASRIKRNSKIKQKRPYKLSLGSSYQFQRFLISADIDYFAKQEREVTDSGLLSSLLTREYKQVTNWAFGIETDLTNLTALRLGVFSDNANSRVDQSIDFQRVEAIDLLGFSAAIATKIDTQKVTFGFYYKHGSGEVRYSDIRAVESIVGLPLFAENDTQDVTNATKESFIAFLSLDF